MHVKLVAHKVVQTTNCQEGMYECLGCWETFCLEHTSGHVCGAPEPPPPPPLCGGGGGGGGGTSSAI